MNPQAPMQVQNLLKWTFGLVPIVAGLDKFFNLLADWQGYLSPNIINALPFEAATFMMLVGLIEIAAGVLVLAKPKVGGLIVAAWMVAIALNLILAGHYDIAVRDLMLAVSAFSLSKLS